ncbi:putative actin interacting protein [Septoria linicola]|nr:putative actin interacting protein [Septoria linicola]
MNGGQAATAMPTGPEDASNGQRGSGGSTRSAGSSRSRQNPQQQLSTIEKSVTHLLVATKQLLETLTMWSTGRATEGEVSDVYVRLGYEFNIACRAFNAIGVDTSDLGPVPDLLRSILEETLSQDASQQSLEKYLPRIRDIIINLLHGLKKKQQRLRQRGTREGGESSSRPPRQASTASNISSATTSTEQLEDVPSRHSSSRTFAQRQGSGDLTGPDLPPRTTSVAGGQRSPKRNALSPQNSVSQRPNEQDTRSTASGSSLSSDTMQNIPVIAPYPESDTMPTNASVEAESSPEPPKPPPKTNDALSALQRGGELERRASRRFSAYQIQKHLGTSINGIPAIPAAQNSPIPNRGRDVRESLNAVRSRGSYMHSRAKSKTQRPQFDSSPNREHDVRRISEESSSQAQDELPAPSRPFAQEFNDEIVKTPEDKLAPPFSPVLEQPSATLNGPIEEPFAPSGEFAAPTRTPTIKRPQRESVRQGREYTPPVSQYVPEGSPQAGVQLTLFLQYKSKIKKFTLPDGGDLSLARLQLAFIEKFAWNTHNNGVDLPEIYIQDSVSGVRHELEDLNDVKERSVLVLNIEALDEVKRHFDDGIGSLRRVVETIKTSVDEQSTSIQRVSDRQQETAKELASLAAAPPPAPVVPASSGTVTSGKDMTGQLKEVQSLRRDLAVVRQTYNSFVQDMQASMNTVRTKASTIKKAAAETVIPDMDNNTGRSYVNNGKKTLSGDSERIVNRVDDLQDIVEDLRKDVVSRGVRPLPRQLEDVSKDISIATSDLKKLQEFLKREKPIWTKIWEKELQVVCDDRDLLTMQEELAADLEDDLEKASQTFALVEEATRQQNLQNPDGAAAPTGVRSTSRTLALKPVADPHEAKDSVLGEVRALQPNHESRLEAIERAEKARQRELENRKEGEFQRELGNFVEEGKLKKTGGHEEVERLRKVREEQARQEASRMMEERRRIMAEKQAAEEAAAEAAEANGEAEPEAGTTEVAELEPPTDDKDPVSDGEGAAFVDAKEEVGTPSETPAP